MMIVVEKAVQWLYELGFALPTVKPNASPIHAIFMLYMKYKGRVEKS